MSAAHSPTYAPQPGLSGTDLGNLSSSVLNTTGDLLVIHLMHEERVLKSRGPFTLIEFSLSILMLKVSRLK